MRFVTTLMALLLLPTAAAAQRELPDGYTGLVGCGAAWLVPTSDSTARIRRVATRRCGDVELRLELAAVSHDSIVVTVRARSPRAALRLPLRLFVDAESVTVHRRGREEPRHYARLHHWVRGGDRPDGTHETIDGWNMRLWRLDDGTADSSRIATLQRGGTTAPRRISFRISDDSGRADSIRVGFTVQALRPAALIPRDPPLFDPEVHLRGRAAVLDTLRFPVPFYEGLVILRFEARAGARRRQAVLDRLQGRVIAVLPRAGDEPDYLVEPGAAWRDSLRQPGLRRLSGETRRFGILLQEPVPPRLPATPVDSTLITMEWDERCHLASDTAVHRRAVLVTLRDGTPAERERFARLLGGRWLPSADEAGAFDLLEVIGTREDVERRITQMRRLPETGLLTLNHAISFHGLACP